MSWDKIWLLEGCAFYIDWFINDIKDELNYPNVLKFDNSSDVRSIISSITAFPFFDVADIIIVSNPTSEIFNECINHLNQIRCSKLIFTCQYNTFDGRQSFVSKANKNKRLKYFDYLEPGDNISSYLQTWNSRIKLTKDCSSWISKNAPTRLAKAKVNGQKKEITIIDLFQLENELGKLYSIYLDDEIPINVDDLINYCNFSRESEIWTFFDAILNNDFKYVVNYFDDYKLTTSNEGVLWVVSSQLELYLQLKCGVSSEKLTLEDKLNFYLGDSFLPITDVKAKPILNPYRLKISQDACNKVSLDSIKNKYIASICAIRDLRAGLSPDLVSFKLSLAYAERNNYLEPIYDV